MTLFNSNSVPLDCDYVNYIENWFVQHVMNTDFAYEEGEFCKVKGYDCYGHYLKHYNFQTKFQSAHLPIPKEITDEAKNWLAQHIKNTDFAYRGKLHLRRHYA